jgi:hypothetical protein
LVFNKKTPIKKERGCDTVAYLFGDIY